MSDVFREVDEDLRQEQMTKMWKQFGPYILGAAFLVVAAVAGYKGYNWYTYNQAANAGLKFEEAIAADLEGGAGQAIADLETISQSAPGSYPILARLSVAGVKARNGDKEGAIADFDAIASTSRIDPEIVMLAQVQAALLLVDTADRALIVARMGDIASGDSAWRHAALEILGIAAWKAGNINDAAALFRQVIGDVETPRGVRQRSQVMLALITPEETAAQETSGTDQ